MEQTCSSAEKHVCSQLAKQRSLSTGVLEQTPSTFPTSVSHNMLYFPCDPGFVIMMRNYSVFKNTEMFSASLIHEGGDWNFGGVFC